MTPPIPGPDRRVMRAYDVAGRIVFAGMLPSIVVKMWRRGKYRKGIRERFGRYGRAFRDGFAARAHPLWVQAVSVGETASAIRFLGEVRDRHPGLPIALSTTTTTGQAQARSRAAEDDLVFYFPLDFRGAVRRALDTVRPRAIVLLESEIWPNLICEATARGIPVAVVNARMSRGSASGYGRWASLFRPVFGQLSLVCAQSEEDAGRLRALGVSPDRLHVTGNLKFDMVPETLDDPGPARRVLAAAGVGEGRRIWVAGSTHPGEEAIIARVYQRLRDRFADLFLVVVPRHVERVADAARDLARGGLRPVLRTSFDVNTPSVRANAPLPEGNAPLPEGNAPLPEGNAPLPAATGPGEGAHDCLLVDTTGELRGFYAVSDLVFVGKSLVGRGGQNIIEPAVYARPVLFGPHMDNFRQVARSFLKAEAMVRVDNEDALEREAAALLADPDRAATLGARARAVVEAQSGVCGRTMDLVERAFGDRWAEPVSTGD